jgi:predicted acetyltransferase
MPVVIAPTRLDDGAVLRPAQAADIAQMLQLESDREGEDDAVDLKLVTETPGGIDGISVVESAGRIVSMATLLNETVAVGDLSLPAGQIEMVATAREFEGRGYVRALMHRSHELSRARGHVAQVMIGIPNFYRQFGYDYSIRMHPWATVNPVAPEQLDLGDTVASVATEDDIDDCRLLQDAAQSAFDVTVPHSSDCWTWLIRHTSSTQVLVRDAAGRARGVARMYDDGEGSVDVGEMAAIDEVATNALLSHALTLAGADGTVRVNLRPHVPALEQKTHDVERTEWYYVRIPDLPGLLTTLAPVLLARAHAAGVDSGDALISYFRRHVRLIWADNQLRVEPGGQLQAPVSAGGSGIPRDAMGSLIFGDGAESLEARFPDAWLGRQADLMRTLFPPQQSDLLTFYLAS